MERIVLKEKFEREHNKCMYENYADYINWVENKLLEELEEKKDILLAIKDMYIQEGIGKNLCCDEVWNSAIEQIENLMMS